MPDQIEPTPTHAPGDPTGQIFVAADDAPTTPIASSDAAPRASAPRTATVVSGRVVLGLIVLAIVIVVVAAASLIPIPGVRTGAVSTVITPAPVAQQLVCPGGLLRLASASGAGATTASAIGVPELTSGAVPGDVIPSAFADSDARDGKSASAPQLLTTPPVAPGGTAALIGGAQSESVSTSEFAGLSSAACASAVAETWLAGGATSVGRTTLLLLANPTAVSSTVAIQIFGETGTVSAPGMDGIVVPAGGQRVLSIAGFAPGLVSPVVHVTSTGGQVVASLEQSTVRGLAPGGIDFVGGENEPASQAVIPGVVVTGTEAIQSVIGQSGFDDLQSTLRVFAPGTKTATVTITVLAEDGSVNGKPTKAVIPAGTVGDLALDSLSDGQYTILVSSTTPVVASVRVSTAGTAAVNGATDFDWVTAAPLLTKDTVVAVANGMTPALHLVNPTAKSETVAIHALAGSDLSAVVAPHSATSVAVVAGTSYELGGFSQLYASVSGVTDGGVTSYVVSPTTRGQGPIRVYG